MLARSCGDRLADLSMDRSDENVGAFSSVKTDVVVVVVGVVFRQYFAVSVSQPVMCQNAD